MAKHLEDGDEVHIIQCLAELKQCEPNPNHSWHVCVICQGKSTRALDLLGIPREHRHSLKPSPSAAPKLPALENLEQLKRFTWREMPVGVEIASMLISVLRNPELDLREVTEMASKAYDSFVQVYESVGRVLDLVKPDKFYVANGRGPIWNAGAQAAVKRAVDVIFHERPTNDSYCLSRDRFHDFEAMKRQLHSAVNQFEEDPLGPIKADTWFDENRRSRKYVDWMRPVFRNRRSGVLPTEFDRGKRNIAIFNSSDDEIAAYEHFRSPNFPDQGEQIRWLTQKLNESPFHLFIREHPFLVSVENNHKRMLHSLASERVTVIPSESPVDSYALLEACETVITFGSTIGIESVYWGTPSILLGKAVFEDLDACYRPNNREELLALMRAPIPPKPKRSAMGFGYWQKSIQLDYSRVSPHGSWGKFGHHALRPPLPIWLFAESITLKMRVLGKIRRTLAR